MTRRRRRTGRRLLGVLVLLVLVELAMQAAGPLVAAWMLRRDGPPPADAPFAALCVGDSNTFGLNVPRSLAYPAQLAGLLGRRFEGDVAVVNRGVPGQNAAQVAGDLARDLIETDPDVVLVLVGVNDTWNTAGEQGGFASLLGRLKLVRLVRVLAAGVTTAEPFEVVTDEHGEFHVRRGDESRPVNPGVAHPAVRSGAALAEHLDARLGRIVSACRDHGAVPVLLTYPEYAGLHGEVNAIVRAAAANHDVLLVDLEQRFGEHFARESYAALMMDDHHPNVRGYELVAAEVAEALDGAELVPVEPELAPRPPPAVEPPPRIEAATDGSLGLSGPPGWPYQVVVSATPGEGTGFDVGPLRVPLAQDDLLDLSRLQPDLSGWLDEEGAARVELSPALRAAAGSRSLSACALLLYPVGTDAPSPIAAVAGPVAVAATP